MNTAPCVIQQNDCTPADLFCDDADPYLVVIISTAVPDLAMHGVTHTQDVVSVFPCVTVQYFVPIWALLGS